LSLSVAAKSGSFLLIQFVKFKNRSVASVKIADVCGMDQFTPEIFGYILPEWDTDTP